MVAVAIDEEHAIAKETGTSVVIFCKEQILEWVAGGNVIGWPTATLTLDGFKEGRDGGIGDPRDSAPRHDWVTIRMEEEIDIEVGKLRSGLGHDLDTEMPPMGPTSRLSTISEHAGASDPSP